MKRKEPDTRIITAPSVRTVSKTAAEDRFRALLPDVDGITEKIIGSDLDHTKAIEVTSKADDLVDWAPNVITWCADKRFLGMRPFAKQSEILLNINEEWCERCSVPGYVQNIPVDASIEQIMTNVALLEFGKCPHCGWTKGMGRKEGVFVDPLELVAVLGQRAGKSSVVSMLVSYQIHRSLKLTVPWQTYGLTPGQVLDFTFCATTAKQSEKTLWSAFKGMFTGSAWFRAYKEVCDAEGKRQGLDETVRSLGTYISFEHKHLLIYFAANDPATLRGTTRIGAAIDELSWFNSDANSGKVRANGPETYAALNNACLTIRGAVQQEIARNPECTWPTAIMNNISSPVSMDDALMTLYRKTAGNRRVVRRHWATWEVNPNLSKKTLTEMGEMDKDTSMRDYGAVPPLASDPLIPRIDIILEAFQHPLATEVRYHKPIRPSYHGYAEEMTVDMGSRSSRFASGRFASVPSPDDIVMKSISPENIAALGPSHALLDELIQKPANRRMHIMGVDIGHTNNSLAIVCGYLALGGKKFVTDFVLEVSASAGVQINSAHIYDNVIVPLVEQLNVVAVYYDRYQSLHAIQDLSLRYGAMGPLNDGHERRKWLRDLAKKHDRPAFIADRYSLNVADALMLVSRLDQGDCLFPAMEVDLMDLLVNRKLDPTAYPYAHLALQLATVRAKGNRLLKPVNRDDDIFRAWANCAVQAFSNELVIDLLHQEVRAEKVKTVNHAGRSHVSLGQTGKGVRAVANQGTGTISSNGGKYVVVRKGTRG